MKDKATAMVLASFAADALALGAHWIYDTDDIERRFGRVEVYRQPQADSYHPTKGAGEFTHYGDQALCLLESLAACRAFDLDRFAQAWRQFFGTYGGYVDHATQETLANFESGRGPAESGSASTDLGGVSRIAPLVYACRRDREALLTAVRAQTALTHNHADVLGGAEFLAELAWRALQGHPPASAIRRLASEGIGGKNVQQWVAAGLETAGEDTRSVIGRFGQMCGIGAALPGVIHLIVRYPGDLREALVQNVMAGGDSAARGMVAGMILGAFLGFQAIPAPWLSDLVHADRIAAGLKVFALKPGTTTAPG